MNIIAITFHEPDMMLEFMIQLPNENSVYRVAAFDGNHSSIFRSDNEVFAGNSFNYEKVLNEYLRRRFGSDFQIIDYSE